MKKVIDFGFGMSYTLRVKILIVSFEKTFEKKLFEKVLKNVLTIYSLRVIVNT